MAGRREDTVTVADVADLAGVSIGTVSKALNGRGQLRTETRRRVLEAAETLGFRSELLAPSLVSGRSYTVGVLTTDDYGRFTLPILAGAEDALGPGRLSMLLCESRGDPVRERHYVRTLLARRVDGIIVTGTSSDPRPSIGRNLAIPVVYALARSDHPDDRSILPDDQGGAVLAVDHLLASGRRDIAIVAGPTDSVASDHRVRGASRALHTAGRLPAAGRAFYGDWSERSGRDAVSGLLDSGATFDGVFCASDQIARGVLDALREAGRRVPDEIGVVGVDNWSVMSTASRPPLTSVDLQLREVGRIAAERLLECVAGTSLEPGVELVPSRLVVRASS